MRDRFFVGNHEALVAETERPERGRFGWPAPRWLPFRTSRAPITAGSAGDGEFKAYLGASPYVRLVAFVLLLLVLLVGITLLDPSVAAAQDRSEILAEAGGRDLDRTAWLEHLPLAMGMALVVIIVDALVIVKVLRDRRSSQSPT